MSISKEDAVNIITAFKLANDLGNESLRLVAAQGLQSEQSEYQRLVGLFMGNSYLNLLRPLTNVFADLSMPEFVQPNGATPRASDPVKQAADAFLFQAKSAIAAFGTVIRQAEVEGALRQGGLEEIVAVVDQIDAHLTSPRTP